MNSPDDPIRLGTRIALALGVLIALAAAIWFVSGEDPGATVVDPNPQNGSQPLRTWSSSVECRDCHREVWDEWVGSQHQIAYLNPEVRATSDDFRNKACQACHLPRPVAVTGYEKRTLHRTTLPDEGVSCLTCHLGSHGEILGRNSVPDAPCAPRADTAFTSVAMCASCHNQHGTTDQWRESHFAAKGMDCNACHMEHRERPLASGALRPGRGHAFLGGHSRSVVLSALHFAVGRSGGELLCSVENHGAGHNFPTEERSRAADIMVRFATADAEIAADTPWQQAYRFRLPYRNEPLPDTTLVAGEERTVRTAIPAGATRAEIRMWYRRAPYIGDDDVRSVLLYETSLDLDGSDIAMRRIEPADYVARPEERPVDRFSAERSGSASDATTAAESSWSGPSLPPLALSPATPALRALAETAPAPLTDDRRAELLDLVEVSFVADRAPPALAMRSRRALLEDPDARRGLEAALTHEDPIVRAHAAFALGELGDPVALPSLLLRLKDEEIGNTPRVVIWLARAIADLGNDSALPFLERMMRHPDWAVEAGQQAIEVCNARGVPLGEAPTYDELATHMLALHRRWNARGYIGETAPQSGTTDPGMLAKVAQHLLDLEEFNLRLVDECRFVLSRLGVVAVPLLRTAVHAEETYVRAHSLEILRDLGPAARELGPDVLPLLGDEFTQVYAAEALGRIGWPGALPHLVARLDHPDAELRAKSAEALATIADSASLAALRKLFAAAEQPIDVRVHAAFALAFADADRDARAWLTAQREAETYHTATLDELLSRLDARGE